MSYGPLASENELSSCHCCCGQCMFQATRSPAHTFASPTAPPDGVHPEEQAGNPRGVFCHEAPDSSSISTTCPAANPAALATVRLVAPCVPSTVRFWEVASSIRGQRFGPTMMIG